MAIMTNKTFVSKLIDIAKNYKTLYVMGCFGAPLNGANVTRYCTNHYYNKQASRTKMIKAVANRGYFGFDCVNLIKGVLWGWNGNASKTYGGATYAINGVPDVSANGMIALCKNISTNFNSIEVGEAVWCEGHIGVYIGDGLAVECTPSWDNKVQITACNCSKNGYNRRNWTKHGKLPYIDYVATVAAKPATPAKKSVEEIAKEVIAGAWGNGDERKNKLIAAGYNYSDVQTAVNNLCASPAPAKKSVTEIAKEVIAGKWGNGTERKNKIVAAGYNYASVQKKVNELLK